MTMIVPKRTIEYMRDRSNDDTVIKKLPQYDSREFAILGEIICNLLTGCHVDVHLAANNTISWAFTRRSKLFEKYMLTKE